jgi:uncharacterized glyoxalase superfamily protein PhnB
MPTSASRPAGAPQVLPYLYYPDATQALAFLIDVFGFTEITALRGADGTVLSAQVSTGDAVVLLGPAMADFGSCAVPDPSWASSRVFVYVDDVDAHHDRSRAGGATIVSEPADHGPNRIYLASDCGGQQWIFATPIG